eukprot:GHUV01023032.1.p1 GENE.GHUV01023032.1~~GHUV01023032.1.p1  ORF type:complete len:130 (+),score=15.96 GHUV01023032.1:283-672(+)
MYKMTWLAMTAFLHEATTSMKLPGLQGTSIMPLLALGRLPHTGLPALVFPMADPLPHPVPPTLKEEAESALRMLHDAGYTHGDIHRRNMLVLEGKVLFCGLEACRSRATPEACAAEIELLHEVLRTIEA